MKFGPALIAATVALATVAAAPARATTVEVRVEAAGAPAPLFAGPVDTGPHPVDGGDGTGAHTCDGPAGGAPTATATGALDDALRGAGITWRGNWDPNFRDFFIERIGAYASRAPDEYWSLTVDGAYAPGGCLATLAEGDEVRFYYGPAYGEQSEAGGGTAGGSGPGGPGAGTSPGAGGSTAPGAGSGSDLARPGRLAARAARYLRRHKESVGELWSALALAARGPREPVATAAAELLRGRLGDLRADGSLGDDVDATALAVIALGRRSPSQANRAVAWLVRVQSESGGFGFRPDAPPDVDTTGLAAWALARQGRHGAARRAALFVAGAHAADGGFPATPGGEANAQSTGLALVALRVAGLGVGRRSSAGATPLEYLATLARPDGSISYAEGSNPTPVWSTAQALLGLLPRGKLLRR